VRLANTADGRDLFTRSASPREKNTSTETGASIR